MKKQLILTLTLLSASIATTSAYRPDTDKNVLKTTITDNAIVYPESFEVDTHKLLESWFVKNYTATDNRYANEPDPQVADEVIRQRLASLPTVIEMPFNQIVRSYIDRYTKGGRDQVAAILGLSLYYMPIFEQALEEQGLPLELKYLPVIESSLDPNAVSKHGAAGLWQFMIGTANGLGLEVNSLVDERRDPYESSQKAALYLKDLYSVFGDWSLAIAAYNCGPGAVNKAIRRAGGDPKKHDFWSIYEYLTPETRGYVPMFIAANYVMNYYPQHNISAVLPVKPLVTDTIQVSERIHFDQISHVLDIPVEELRVLNPQFRADIIPGTVDSPYTLVLPSQQIHAYLMSENDIRNYDADKYARRTSVEPGVSTAEALMSSNSSAASLVDRDESDVAIARGQGGQAVVHKVVPGETLSSIAEKYGVTVAELKTMNNLRRNAVRVGQQLRISAGDEAPVESLAKTEQKATPSKQQTASKTQSASKTQAAPKVASTHTIKKGETLSTIASKYGVSVTALKNANGMKSDKISAGKTLKIPAKTAVKKSTAKKSTAKKRR